MPCGMSLSSYYNKFDEDPRGFARAVADLEWREGTENAILRCSNFAAKPVPCPPHRSVEHEYEKIMRFERELSAQRWFCVDALQTGAWREKSRVAPRDKRRENSNNMSKNVAISLV